VVNLGNRNKFDNSALLKCAILSRYESEIYESIVDLLREKVLLFEYASAKFLQVLNGVVGVDFDVLISLGGDGTFLKILRAFYYSVGVFIPINAGKIGFLTNKWDCSNFSGEKLITALKVMANLKEERVKSFSVDYLDEINAQLLKREVKPGIIKRRMVAFWLKKDVEGGEKRCVKNFDFGLNEIYLTTAVPGRVFEFEVWVDDVRWGRFRGDGLIVSSQSGSTGYALSTGGPVVNIDALIVVPVAIHSAMLPRSLVLGVESKISVRALSDGLIVVDGQRFWQFEVGEVVEVSSWKEARVLYFEGYNYLKRINEKLLHQ